MKKIIFLHGFFASGQCMPALALKEALADNVEALTPDLPMHPNASLAFIQALCEQTHPDLLVGNSCGAFLAQLIAPTMAIPALLGNPHFEMTKFLQVRMGAHRYKSPAGMANRISSSTNRSSRHSAHWNQTSSPLANPLSETRFGDYLVSRTPSPTTSRSSCNITITPFIFPVAIRPPLKRSSCGMCR